MKRLVGKIVAGVLTFTMLMSFTACGKEKIDNDNIKISNLSQFKIVYPSDYEVWQMEEVKLLQNVIEHLTGKKIEAVTDETEKKGHEIILASSKRENSISETVKNFESDIDYVIAVDSGDIILGGKSYYGDMKAVYDFVNNYLGYDDTTDTYVNEKSESKENSGETPAEDTKPELLPITGIKTEIYVEPVFTIMVANPGEYPFRNAGDVKVLAEAGFNMVKLDTMKFTQENLYKYLTWCARYNVRVIEQSVYNVRKDEFIMNDIDFESNNPMIFGHYVNIVGADEFAGDKVGTVYREQFGKYGWKLVANFKSEPYNPETEKTPYVFTELFENNEMYKDTDIISVKHYLGIAENGIFRESFKHLNAINEFKNVAKRNNNEFWLSVSTSDIGFTSDQRNVSRVFCWTSYIALGYGVTGIEYSVYKRGAVINDNYTKSRLYDTIKETNEEIMNLAKVYTQYNFLGINTINYEEYDEFSKIDKSYDKFSELMTIDESKILDPYLISTFESKDGSGKYAFVIVNNKEVTKANTASLPMQIKLNGNKVTLYDKGKAKELQKNDNGNYLVSVSNGRGVLITVE